MSEPFVICNIKGHCTTTHINIIDILHRCQERSIPVKQYHNFTLLYIPDTKLRISIFKASASQHHFINLTGIRRTEDISDVISQLQDILADCIIVSEFQVDNLTIKTKLTWLTQKHIRHCLRAEHPHIWCRQHRESFAGICIKPKRGQSKGGPTALLYPKSKTLIVVGVKTVEECCHLIQLITQDLKDANILM